MEKGLSRMTGKSLGPSSLKSCSLRAQCGESCTLRSGRGSCAPSWTWLPTSLRKMGEKVKGFTRLMAIINRKQIPVCSWCHHEIHAGRYDGLKVNTLAEGMGMEN